MFGNATDNQADVERRAGVERRSGIERRHGFAVLLAGCQECGRVAGSAADMHTEGWLILADEEGITLIACPEHRGLHESPSRPADTTDPAY